MSSVEVLEQIIYDENIRLLENPELPDAADGFYYSNNKKKLICLRPHMRHTQRLCVLAEEYGHAKTSWGDARKMDEVSISKQEAKAIAYAIRLLVPFDRLKEALNSGARNEYECAEYLGITQEFLSWVIAYYKKKYPKWGQGC